MGSLAQSARLSVEIGLFSFFLCTLCVAQVPAPSAEDAIFQDLPVVEAAALHAQTLADAPANVTLITASDIRRYGYRTLGDALSTVRGFWTVNDRLYQYVGARGINLPQDYNTRFLVMINGHPMTEIIFGSNNFFGQDFGLDMDLVERIEIIRGPTSALYGSNGMLANINVITRSPVDEHRAEVSVETGGPADRKIFGLTSLDLGKGANLLFAGSVFNNGGRSFLVPEFANGPAGGLSSMRSDGERGYHSFANLVWRDWSFTAYFNSREKHSPLLWVDDPVFDDPSGLIQDRRNMVGATYTRSLRKGKLRWQTYFDQYFYRDIQPYYQGEDYAQSRTSVNGDWIDSQLTYQLPAGKRNTLTFGVQTAFELRNLQFTTTEAPLPDPPVRADHPDRQFAVFAQEELQISRKWTAYLGIRFDDSRNFGSEPSPRLALVYQPNQKTSLKAVYGRPFRNPTAYEQYWHDNGLSILPNQGLRAETAHAFEVSAERKVTKNWSLVWNVYHYAMTDLIEAAPVDSVLQFQNATAARSDGLEMEVSGRLGPVVLNASGAFQYSHDRTIGWLPNSPRQIGTGRASLPLWRDRVWLSGQTLIMSPRNTSDGQQTQPVYLGDLTISTNRLNPSFDLVGGVRNLWDWRYSDPSGTAVSQMPTLGRTLFVKLIWTSHE